MTWQHSYLLAAATWPACGCIFFIAVCRLNAMPKETFFRVQLEYSMWAGIGFCTPLLPFIGEWPGVGMVIGLYALLTILLCSARAWAGDNAPDEATDNAPLEIPLGIRLRVVVAWERLKDRAAAEWKRITGGQDGNK